MCMAVTPDLVAAFSLCPRKAFLILRGDDAEQLHEYVNVTDRVAGQSRDRFIASIDNGDVCRSSQLRLDWNASANIDAEIVVGDLAAQIQFVLRRATHQAKAKGEFEPHLFIGTHVVNNEDKLRLALMGKIVAESTNSPCSGGVIVAPDGKSQRVAFANIASQLNQFLGVLRLWLASLPDEPPIILNDHCPICPFRAQCLRKAEQEDNLTLLDRMTPKLLKKYHKKGIFTINQLSYLFRPRKTRRRGALASTAFSFELQALALRTRKTYLHHTPSIPSHAVELFLDIEGLPDRDFQYLIGVVVWRGSKFASHSFWANSPDDEANVFRSLLAVVAEHPTAPIYHYGSYERNALERAAKRHGLDLAQVQERLVNVNTLIYAKVYFPSRSNSLKVLGSLVGATWTATDSSGLNCIAWRLEWEATKETRFKDQIEAYNLDDCHALRHLVSELRSLGEAATSRLDVDFSDRPKQHATLTGTAIHDSLEGILESAHAGYDKNRIGVGRRKARSTTGRKGPGALKGHIGYRRIIPSKANRTRRVRRRIKCPANKTHVLVSTSELAQYTVVDIAFSKGGCRKTVTKLVGRYSYCPRCNRRLPPPSFRKQNGFLFGHCFRAWAVYQRISLRLPYHAICQVIGDQFQEYVTPASIVKFVSAVAEQYGSTERELLCRILSSPFIHVDETKLSIQGTTHFVWVLTDGSHVAFKLTETRETTLLQSMLDGYAGILVTDFYGGYDAFKCRQQKCLVHLIRDLNDDLWKNPFNKELEGFVGSVKELLVPIIDDVHRFGLKRHFLRKHERSVSQFYKNTIDDHRYDCDITARFHKRFVRYRESLFRFLTEDGIPWNNNMGERAIRHLAVQRKISGSFYKRVAPHYLRLLAINQTCRFQEKSFLRFLLSGQKDVDQFKDRRRKKASRAVTRKDDAL